MAPVIIEDDIWIGAHSVIMGNVRLKKGAVVAAGAVVTGDVPEYKIVGGTPARIIGDRKLNCHIYNKIIDPETSKKDDFLNYL
jgi:acetyltransferase-like isoleucine patch superfamily enzyme